MSPGLELEPIPQVLKTLCEPWEGRTGRGLRLTSVLGNYGDWYPFLSYFVAKFKLAEHLERTQFLYILLESDIWAFSCSISMVL